MPRFPAMSSENGKADGWHGGTTSDDEGSLEKFVVNEESIFSIYQSIGSVLKIPRSPLAQT